ncbi:MAG: response regulator [Chloroflexota bacterium]
MLEDKWALVVEDDAHNLVAISSILRDLGIRFKRNTTGVNVQQQMIDMNPLPNFVLLDIDLPNGDAFIIQRRIQAVPALSAVPVIALAAEEDFTLRQQLDQAGFAAFVLKPISRRPFTQLLERLLANERV